MVFRRIAILMAIVLCVAFCSMEAKGEDMAIKKGSEVSFSYTLIVDGQMVDSSDGKELFRYTHGEGKIIPGLSRQLEGMSEGEEKQITLQPSEAYGEISSAAYKVVEKSQLPPDIKPQVDMLLQVATPDGRNVPVRISEVKEKSIVLDSNHPFAGKTLIFQVKIASVK